MAVEGLKHAAYAIGSLAFGDVRGASTHAAAAAAFGVGAAAAAVAAREFGHGGTDYKPPEAPKEATAGGASGGSGGSGSGGSNGKGGGNVYYIAYGSEFQEDSPRQRRLRAEKVVRQALGGEGGMDS
jgi:hypothetical protein